jgi:hypothetical protein
VTGFQGRRRVALTLLVLSLIGTAALHLRVERRDHSWLLLVDGVPRDPLGAAAEAWQRARRDCSGVEVLQPDDAAWQAARGAVAAYSPPDSASARLTRALALGEWRLVEARFDALPPVVVVLRVEGDAPRVLERAVWSGSTAPWEPGPLIRRYLGARAPGVPKALLACFTTERIAWSRPSAAPPP